MFDGVLETRARVMSARALSGLPGAAAVHFLFLGTLLAFALLAVEPVVPPDLPIWGPPSGPPPLIIQFGTENGGGGEKKPKAPEPKSELPKPEPSKPEALVQPPDVPADRATPPEATAVPDRRDQPDAGTGGDEAGPRGSPLGSPEGGPEGVPWGVPGGDPLGRGGGGPGPGGGGGPGDGNQGTDDVLRLTPEMRAPVKIAGAPPEYPDLARRARVEGKVILEVIVDTNGDVGGIQVLKSEPLLDRAAMEAVSRWKYRPALQQGRPVKVFFTVVIEFHLH